MTDTFHAGKKKQAADEQAIDEKTAGEKAAGERDGMPLGRHEAQRKEASRECDQEPREKTPRDNRDGVLHEGDGEHVVVRGRKIEKADIFKFVGLIAFFGLMVLICVLLWPYFHDLFEPGGIDRIIDDVRGAGPVGFLILLGLQFLQIVVAFIPGEVVQVAAGMLYGPWLGALIIFIGCVFSSAFIFVLVHKLGAPFVQSMVPTNYLEKFRRFEKTGKLNIIVFVLFLIPGLPKDVFTYLVPLTDMRMRTFLVLSNIGRIPGIVVSTYAADGLVEGRIIESVAIFAVAAVIALLGVIFRERIMGLLGKSHNKDK